MKRRQSAPWERKLAKVLQIFFLALLGLFLIWRINLYFEVSRRIDAIKTARLPISGQELDDWRRPVPDAENAALVLTQAFSPLWTFPDTRSQEISTALMVPRLQWTNGTQEAVAEYVSRNKEALAKAREIFERPKCRYDVDLSYGFDALFPHHDKLKNLAGVAVLHGALCRSNLWVEDVRLVVRLATTLDDEPTVISHLTRASLLRTAARSVEQNLNIPNVEMGNIELLESDFATAEETNLLPLALIGERAMAVPTFRMSRSEIQQETKQDEAGNHVSKPQRLTGHPWGVMALTGIFERDLNFYLQVMETNIALATLPPRASLAATNVVSECSELARKKHYILSSLILPALARVAVREATTQAQLRLARTGLAVERFRTTKQHLPQTLSELVPEFIPAVPVDPFDGKPMRFHRLEKGYVIYSVDRDGHDDDGREKPVRVKSFDTNSYDLTFIVER